MLSKQGREKARSQVQDASKFSVEDFRWAGAVPEALRFGTRIVRCPDLNDRKTVVEPPERVLSVRRYRSGRGRARALVFVEARKWARAKTLSSVIRRVPTAAILRKVGTFREIRDPQLVFQLARLWANST